MVEFSVSFSTYDQGKAYIAEITGTDRKFRFAREFMAAKKSSSRSGATGTKTAHVGYGIYELSSTGRKGSVVQYMVVTDDDRTRQIPASEIDAVVKEYEHSTNKKGACALFYSQFTDQTEPE